MPPNSRPTLRDVAERAGVSKSTVSRVINNEPYVGLDAHRRVMAAMEEVGYARNEVARSLRLRATGTIGLVVSSLRNEVFAGIAQGIDLALDGSRRTLLVTASHDDEDREIAELHELLRRGVDGVIMSLSNDRSARIRKELRRVRVPVVLLDRDCSQVAIDRVLTDHAHGVAAAVDDIVGHGHERVGLIAPPLAIRPGREVKGAFVERFGSADWVRNGPLTDEFGFAATSELLDGEAPPTALIVTGTQVLAGVLTLLQERGLDVPGDLSLVAYDDSAAARFHTPPISALVRDLERIGGLAAQLVMDRIDGRRTQSSKAIVPTAYVTRGTVVEPSVSAT